VSEERVDVVLGQTWVAWVSSIQRDGLVVEVPSAGNERKSVGAVVTLVGVLVEPGLV
jgi:hypothetical protein